MNTEQTTTDDPKPTQTTFHFDPGEYSDVKMVCGQGVHEASLEDTLAPFYRDPYQRVLAVRLDGCHDFAVKVEVLLKLARQQGGADVEWEQWRAHAVVVDVGVNFESRLYVPGSRLFSIEWDIESSDESSDVSWMNVLDLNPRASARYVGAVSSGTQGFTWEILRPGDSDMDSFELPWDIDLIRFSNCGNDSLVYLVVRIPRSLNLAKS